MHAFLVSVPPSKYPPGPDCLHLTPETSLGIAEVRQIQSFLSKKPLSLPVNVVVIHQAEKLTLPAQHALLKTLEEPPGNSQIFLVTSFPDQLLPTIISRIQTSDRVTVRSVDKNQLHTSETLIKKLLLAEMGEKLLLIHKQNFTRESALEFLDCLESVLHQNLSLKLNYHLIHTTRKYLTANVSVKLAMDNFALSL